MLVRQIIEDAVIVSVVPVTHSPPVDPADAVAMPPGLKRHLGLDDQPSWIVISELNDFVWPGPDLRPIPGKTDRYEYGVLPPSFFRQLQETIFARITSKKLAVVARTE